MQDVPARDGRITLGQLLKLTGTVDRGSDVRPFLAAGRVRVNGVAETRRGRKLVAGSWLKKSSQRTGARPVSGRLALGWLAQMGEQQHQRRGRHAFHAGRLGQRRGALVLEPLAHFAG